VQETPETVLGYSTLPRLVVLNLNISQTREWLVSLEKAAQKTAIGRKKDRNEYVFAAAANRSPPVITGFIAFRQQHVT